MTRSYTQQKERAFTLIELIIVIVVLGILSTIAIVGYQTVINKSTEAKQVSRMTQVLKEAKVLYVQNIYSDSAYTWAQAVASAIDDLPTYTTNALAYGPQAQGASNQNSATNGWTAQIDVLATDAIYSAAPNDIVMYTTPAGTVYVASAISSTKGVFGMVSQTTAPFVWVAGCAGSTCDATTASSGPPAGGSYAAGITTTTTTTPPLTGTISTSADQLSPYGLALDSVGNIYFAEISSDRIRKITVATGIITTVAGTGTAGYSGDGGPATSANLWGPWGIAVDPSGNIYTTDTINGRVRKVTASTGIITTVAGTGVNGYSGDGGLATAAMLEYPQTLALDSAGNIYVSDQTGRVRKVTVSTGIITTVAGTGVNGYSGDGGLATAAMLTNPTGLAVDSAGNIYISEDSRIRKVAASTGIITTVAGTGVNGYSGDGGLAASAMLDYPAFLSLDSAGNIYIPDSGNHRFRKVTVSTGIITTVAGSGVPGFSGDGGLATAADLDQPRHIVVDATGNLYISVQGRIRKVTYGP